MIEWCDYTFNPWVGCRKISPGCDHCYAEMLAKRFRPWVQWGGDYDDQNQQTDRYWEAPISWNLRQVKLGRPGLVFCGSMCDFFQGDTKCLDRTRRRLLLTVEDTPHLVWLMLTKRPAQIRRMHWRVPMGPSAGFGNMWFGISAENQRFADQRWDDLSVYDAGRRFTSLEPLLEPVSVHGMMEKAKGTRPDWVIVGAESGPGRRPCKSEWVARVIVHCRELGIPVFVKQIHIHGKVSKHPEEWPPWLRVREWPAEFLRNPPQSPLRRGDEGRGTPEAGFRGDDQDPPRSPFLKGGRGEGAPLSPPVKRGEGRGVMERVSRRRERGGRLEWMGS